MNMSMVDSTILQILYTYIWGCVQQTSSNVGEAMQIVLVACRAKTRSLGPSNMQAFRSTMPANQATWHPRRQLM